MSLTNNITQHTKSHEINFDNSSNMPNEKLNLKYNYYYIKSLKAITQLIHLFLAIICLALVLSVDHYTFHDNIDTYSILDTSIGPYIRVFTFILVYTLLFTSVTLFVHMYNIHVFISHEINLIKLEMTLYIIFTVMYFLISPIMIGSLTYYHYLFVNKSAFRQLLISSVLSYLCMITCAMIALVTWNQNSIPAFYSSIISRGRNFRRFSISTLTSI
ncbi:unnamed protein product [Gordionus sp. m RMFG-2023]